MMLFHPIYHFYDSFAIIFITLMIITIVILINMNTLAERLKYAREAAGISQAELAKRADLRSQSAIAMLETGQKKGSASIADIAQALNVDVHWLSKGIGQMKKDHLLDEILAHTSPNGVTTNQLSSEEFAQKIWVDLVEIDFSCGSGESIEFHFEPIEIKKLSFESSFFTKRGLKPENCRFAYAKGRSMEPYLFDGDVFGMDITDTNPKDGEIYAVYLGGEAMLKQTFIEGQSRLTLHSYNPEWKDKIVDENNGSDFRVIGRQFWRAG